MQILFTSLVSLSSKLVKVFSGILLLNLFLPSNTVAADPSFWKSVAPGFEHAVYELPTEQSVIKSEIVLLKINPLKFILDIALASELSTKRTSVRSLALKHRALAAINSNFFDTQDDPLGLIIRNKTQLHRMHTGGSLLTGIFLLTSENVPKIIHRSQMPSTLPRLALQAGPRLISGGKKLPFKDGFQTSRRSGIAINASSEVILFATRLRFPGASFNEIQDMLLDPKIQAIDALNFDGGSSSQLFINSFPPAIAQEEFISGGDNVPVALIVKKR